MITRKKFRVLLPAAAVVAAGFLLPERCLILAEHTYIQEGNRQAFQVYPCGSPLTHKEIDIFAEEDRSVVGAAGNARGRLLRLHYLVFTRLSYFTRWDSSHQVGRKIFSPDLDEKLHHG